MINYKSGYYRNNDDVVVVVAQCGDYIREYAGDLIGRVIGDKQDGNIKTINLYITINISPENIPTITVNKDILVPITIPFTDDED